MSLFIRRFVIQSKLSLIFTKAAFTWSLIWKLTDMKLKKVISPSGQIYLNVYMFRNDRPIWNTTPDMSWSEHICSTGLRMKTWKLIITYFRDFFLKPNIFEIFFEMHSIFYKNNFIRTRALYLTKSYEQAKNNSPDIPGNVTRHSRECYQFFV